MAAAARRIPMNQEQPSNINTPQYWDAVYRREWESKAVTSGRYQRDYAPIHDAIIALIPDGASVLDIGCGPGLLCRKIKRARPRARVMGVDFSAVTIENNRATEPELGVEYAVVDIRTALPSLPRDWDVISMCEVIEHLDEPLRILDEAVALLRPGGLFILTTPHDNEIPSPEHVRQWGHDELFHVLAKYADTVSFTHFPPPWFSPWMMAHFVKRG